jgi:uncharacterized protein YjiS (DUF1127 family)
MRTSTNLDTLIPLEEDTPRGVITCRDAAIVILRRGPAVDDAIRGGAVSTKDEVESWAQHALATNGFGDVATADMASSAQPTSYRLHQDARVHSSLTLGDIIVAAIHTVGAIARRAYARYRQRRQARATYDILRRLDDRTLRDLGFDRSEIRSVAAELTGEVEYTHVRALQTFYNLPR